MRVKTLPLSSLVRSKGREVTGCYVSCQGGRQNVESGWSNNKVGGDKISSNEPDSDSGLGHSCLRATKFLIL